jgi:tetratricopeptide (TPR) repeat protein
MKKLIFIICFLVPALLWPNDNTLLMEEAARNYNDENYSQAAEIYLKVIENGFESADLYYNLGNTYFKMGDIPTALLYFEKARKLNPADEDIRFNIQIANSKIVDKIDNVPEVFWIRWWNQLVYSFTVDQWGWLSVGAFTLIFVMTLIFLLSNVVWLKKITFWMGILMLLIFTATYFLSNQKFDSFQRDYEAIIFTPTLTVKSSPSESGTDIFVIHEGTKVRITDQIGEWYKIEIANGSVGWIKEDAMKKI